MTLFPFVSWSRQQRRGKSRQRPKRPRLTYEGLEDRTLLAADLLMDINTQPFTVGLSDLVPYRDGIAYAAVDTASEVSIWFSNRDGDTESIPKAVHSAGVLRIHDGDIYYVNNIPAVVSPHNEGPAVTPRLSGVRQFTVWRTDPLFHAA